MNNTDIANKLLDTFDKTLNTINQLLASQPATLKVETADQPIIKQTTNKPVSTKTIVNDRLVTKKQIRAMFGYNFDFRSNICDSENGGPWTVTLNEKSVQCIPESQLCDTFKIKAPLDFDKKYYASTKEIAQIIGVEPTPNFNKAMSVMANDKRLPAVKLGGPRGSWRYPTDYANTAISSARKEAGWNATPERLKAHFLKALGYGPRGLRK